MRSMLGSRLIADRIDDDMIRRLVHGIEELADAVIMESSSTGLRGTPDAVTYSLDGDLAVAYQEVREMMAQSYPETYGND